MPLLKGGDRVTIKNRLDYKIALYEEKLRKLSKEDK